MNREPIRHHFIPQFILRNFCFNEKQLYYFDKQAEHVLTREPRDIFVEKNLYRDEKNYAFDPVRIEKDLAAYEQEVATLIRERFLQGKDIDLSLAEEEKLKLFLAIMGFRSVNTKKCFDGGLSKQGKRLYRKNQPDGDFLDLWKRNLGYIVNCRSFREVADHPNIDKPIKLFFHRDTKGYSGRYIAVAETKEEDSFVIGDIYPVVITGTTAFGTVLNLYDIYPISPNRVILLANNGAQGTPRDVLELREFLLQPPKKVDEEHIRLRVRTLSTDELQYLNREIAACACQGFAFKHQPSILKLQ